MQNNELCTDVSSLTKSCENQLYVQIVSENLVDTFSIKDNFLGHLHQEIIFKQITIVIFITLRLSTSNLCIKATFYFYGGRKAAVLISL